METVNTRFFVKIDKNGEKNYGKEKKSYMLYDRLLTENKKKAIIYTESKEDLFKITRIERGSA